MSAKILEECPVCHKKFVQDSEELYWHLKIHLAKIEIAQEQKIPKYEICKICGTSRFL